MAGAEEALPWHKRGHGKWGKYLPHQRGNVDQVPLSFVFEMDYTYEEKCAKRVAINQLSESMSKWQCTGQVCFRPEPSPPPPDDAPAEVSSAFVDRSASAPSRHRRRRMTPPLRSRRSTRSI
eukprot:2948857-Prymnesium_polylepis.1